MTLTPVQLDAVVEQVIARLLSRQQQCLRLSVAGLRMADASTRMADYAALHICDADSLFLSRLAYGEGDDPALQNLHDALAAGLTVTVSVHHQLLPLLHVRQLARLPVQFVDEGGLRVHLCRDRVLSYRHIAGLGSGWLLVPPDVPVTPLARESAAARGIKLVKQE